MSKHDRRLLEQDFAHAKSTNWNTYRGLWLDRKRRWVRCAQLKSETGRDEELTYSVAKYLSDGSRGRKMDCQTSTFDPVVAELAYQWWCPPGGLVLDPFAGGSVRGIVASMKGKRYHGIDIRSEQIEANIAQLNSENTGEHPPAWHVGDAYKVLPDAPRADLIFTCPPYGSLERYSKNNIDDLSNMTVERFDTRYREIVKRACNRLRLDRYAVLVVGNYRQPNPDRLIDLRGKTVRAFEEAGLRFWTEAILATPMGSGPVRMGNTFDKGHHKLVTVHQYVLVFIKGSAERAANAVRGVAEAGAIPHE